MKKGKKIFLIALFSLLAIFIFSSLYINSQKERIVDFLVHSLNNQIKGDIVYSEIELAPFKHLPDIALSIKDPAFLYSDSTGVDTLMHFKHIDLSIDLFHILKSSIDINKLFLYSGSIKIEQMEDSTYALFDAFEKINTSQETKNDSSDLKLNITELYANNVYLNLTQKTHPARVIDHIDQLHASFNFNNDSIICSIDLQSNLILAKVDGKEVLSHENLNIKGDFTYHEDQKKLKLENTKLILSKADFDLAGTLHFDEKFLIDIQFQADDSNLKFTRLFFASDQYKIIKSGKLIFNGSIIGSFRDEIPRIKFAFGADNLNLVIPETANEINNLNFSGRFDAGKSRDLSDASLAIDSIRGNLPKGFINGYFAIKNFKDPYLDYDLEIQAQIDGFDKLLDRSSIDSLTGFIHLKNKYLGYLHDKDSVKIDVKSESSLELKDVCFTIAKNFRFRNIHSNIYSSQSLLHLDSTSLILNGTTIIVEGRIKNHLQLFLASDEKTFATLHISTPSYDFPKFFSYSKNIASSFPYVIEDVEIELTVSTSKKDLSSISILPWIAFEFKHLSGNIPQLCGPIEILNGDFLLHDKNSKAELKFEDFRLQVNEHPINLDLLYSFAPSMADSLVINSQFEQFDLIKNLHFNFLSSLKDSSSLLLDGKVYAELLWSNDSIPYIKQLDFQADSISFAKENPIIKCKNTRITGANIHSFSGGENSFSSLSGDLKFNFEEIYTALFKDENIGFQAHFDRGHLELKASYDNDPMRQTLFNVSSRPFDSIPNYHLKHHQKNVNIKNLFPSKSSESLVLGNVDLDIDVTFRGNSTQSILRSLKGELILKGDSIKMMGIDVDELIKKFQRSQNFNLVDLGAVLIAGPVGLVFSKGSDYALMLVGNNNDSSIINIIYSKWELKEGLFLAKDFAFATAENRIAIEGWINLDRDSLDLDIALVNTLGCSIISQGLNGKLSDPKTGKLKVIKTALAPVTNPIEKVINKDCDVFYDGVVKPVVTEK